MASPEPERRRYPPTLFCDPAFLEDATPGRHNCHPEGPVEDYDWYMLHPGLVPPGPVPRHHQRPAGLSAGFNFGMMMLPFVLDHGDCVGTIRRKDAYATILHSWPSPEDRGRALIWLDAFARKSDRYYPPLTIFLINAPPFAGWRWDARLLNEWLDFAKTQAAGLGAPGTLAGPLATTAAITWCSNVRAFWEARTVEAFPYDARTMVPYWRVLEIRADLS